VDRPIHELAAEAEADPERQAEGRGEHQPELIRLDRPRRQAAGYSTLNRSPPCLRAMSSSRRAASWRCFSPRSGASRAHAAVDALHFLLDERRRFDARLVHPDLAARLRFGRLQLADAQPRAVAIEEPLPGRSGRRRGIVAAGRRGQAWPTSAPRACVISAAAR
jgi:hypothetical protein